MAEGKELFFSVIIPSRDRPKLLQQCLTSLEKQSLNANNFEVIVVDDGSKEPLNKLLHSYKPAFSFVVLCQKNAGPASARNLGARAAKGKILAFLDDDCVASPPWLESAKKVFKKEAIDVLEGTTLVASPESVNALSSQRENLSGNRFLCCNVFYTKTSFNSLNGFDEAFGSALCEDTDMGWRTIAKGFRTKFCTDVVIFHSVLNSNAFSFLFKRLKAKWSYWNVLLAAKHPVLYKKHYAFLHFFNPVLAPNYPFYFAIIFFLFSPFTFFIKVGVLLLFYTLTVILNTRLIEGATLKRIFSHPFALFQSFLVLWILAFSEFFFNLLGIIRFRRVLL